ncbi:MAG: ATP-dependent DNA ligase [Dehalococcoidia bacterium]
MLQPPIEPMLAKLTPSIPQDGAWVYEPKWDGFRCLAFIKGGNVYLQSRDSRPLARYFPELAEALPRILAGPCVLDGEIVLMGPRGLEFDTLQLRLHPAESRVRKLANETPASYVAFDLLWEGGDDLRADPFAARRARLETLLGGVPPPLHLTPATTDPAVAADWFSRFEGAGFDGVIAKPAAVTYQPGVRAMAKIKHLRTADCVVGGYRWYKDMEGRAIGSLLLGLYDDDSAFHLVGHTSSFSAKEKQELVPLLAPYVTSDEGESFDGRAPGGPSRWSQGKDQSWVRLRPELVCEVTFDYLQGPRFRHASTFKRWRTDKPPADCRFDQFIAAVPAELAEVFAARG